MLKERIQINDPNAVPYAAAKLEVIHRAQEKISKFCSQELLFYFLGIQIRVQL